MITKIKVTDGNEEGSKYVEVYRTKYSIPYDHIGDTYQMDSGIMMEIAREEVALCINSIYVEDIWKSLFNKGIKKMMDENITDEEAKYAYYVENRNSFIMNLISLRPEAAKYLSKKCYADILKSIYTSITKLDIKPIDDFITYDEPPYDDDYYEEDEDYSYEDEY